MDVAARSVLLQNNCADGHDDSSRTARQRQQRPAGVAGRGIRVDRYTHGHHRADLAAVYFAMGAERHASGTVFYRSVCCCAVRGVDHHRAHIVAWVPAGPGHWLRADGSGPGDAERAYTRVGAGGDGRVWGGLRHGRSANESIGGRGRRGGNGEPAQFRLGHWSRSLLTTYSDRSAASLFVGVSFRGDVLRAGVSSLLSLRYLSDGGSRAPGRDRAAESSGSRFGNHRRGVGAFLYLRRNRDQYWRLGGGRYQAAGRARDQLDDHGAIIFLRGTDDGSRRRSTD